MARLELRNLTKTLRRPAVVDDVSLEVAEGEFLVLLGPSGCGKTTTLQMVAGFIAAHRGASCSTATATSPP